MAKRADRKKFHILYKTTCLLTNRYYIGMHSTDNLEDNYIGSGKRLNYSIKKYGLENHQKEILELCETREALRNREKELVNPEVMKDPLCMNLKLGGEGGWDHIWKDPKHIENKRIQLIEMTKFRHKNGLVYYKNFSGKRHTSLTKHIIGSKNSLHQSGSKNSQFGKKWIFNEVEKRSIRIEPQELNFYLTKGWLIGRKIKFY